MYFRLRPNLLIMDITMPEMDGIEDVRQICMKEIIIVSAMGKNTWSGRPYRMVPKISSSSR